MATSTLSATDNDFLGSAYEVPASSGGGGKYLKFKNGTTHFRVLSQKALKGWEYWTTDNKSKRLREMPTSTPTDIRIAEDGKAERIRHFWAMAVWDYETSTVKILKITQSTVQKSIVALVQDSDFGHPTKYDLKVSRSGEKLETEYNVMPLHKPMPQEAIDALEQTPIYLDALWVGADPFSPESEKYAPAMPTISNVDIVRKWVEDSGLEPAKAKEIRERLLGKKKFADYTTDDMSKLKTALEVAAADAEESEPTIEDEVDLGEVEKVALPW